MSNNTKKEKTLTLFFFGLGVFLIMLVFFTRIHSLVLFDTDDWTYASYSRQAVPLWKNWNPTRVFPEIFMSFCYDFAAYVIYPLTGDYLGAGIFISAFIVSGWICFYLVTFVRLLRDKFNISTKLSICAGILFFLMHFWIFRSARTGNQHMFYSGDICCYYYYIIPDLLNCILVMLVMINGSPEQLFHPSGVVKKSALILLMYLALFSNLYASIIFAVYLGWKLLMNLLSFLRRRKKGQNADSYFINWLRQNRISILYLLLWAMVQFFEVNGGRASSLKTDNSYLSVYKATLRHAWELKGEVNHYFVLFSALTIIISIVLIAKKKLKDSQNIKKINITCRDCFVTAAIIFIYLTLVCTKQYSSAIKRADILFGALFFLLLMVTLLFTYIVQSFRVTKAWIPLLLMVIFYQINASSDIIFKDSNTVGWTDKQCQYTSQKIINQFITADKEHQDSIVLSVPQFNGDHNWPIMTTACGAIEKTLRKHGVISHDISISEVRVIENADFQNLQIK